MTVTTVEKKSAHSAGRMAARTGRPLTSCPYQPSDGGREKVLALWFVRGFRSCETPDSAPSD